MTDDDILSVTSFTAATPNGAVIACSVDRRTAVLAKHPVLGGHANAVRDAIQAPMEIRRSRWATDVWPCYGPFKARLVCAVIAPRTGALITAYPTDALKPGDCIWTPSE